MGDEVAAHGAGDEATDEPAAGDEEEGEEEVADGEEVFAGSKGRGRGSRMRRGIS